MQRLSTCDRGRLCQRLGLMSEGKGTFAQCTIVAMVAGLECARRERQEGTKWHEDVHALMGVTRRELQTPGTAEEHNRQETPTVNPNDHRPTKLTCVDVMPTCHKFIVPLIRRNGTEAGKPGRKAGVPKVQVPGDVVMTLRCGHTRCGRVAALSPEGARRVLCLRCPEVGPL